MKRIPHDLVLGLAAEKCGQRFRAGGHPLESVVLSPLDGAILRAVQAIIEPEICFEFGTYRGDTARMLAERSRVYTLDLQNKDGVTFEGNDDNIATLSINARRTIEMAPRVNQLLGDSLYFHPPYELLGAVQLVLIDGNHARKYVEKDTENAFLMLDAERPACVLWHDYRNPAHPDLAAYLDELSEARGLRQFGKTDGFVVYHQNCPDLAALDVAAF